MFVSIDMDSLEFAHAHREYEPLSALAWLEMPDRSVLIENTEREHFLCKLTSLELRLLYKNTTGASIDGNEDIVVREVLATIVETQLKTTFVSLPELMVQIDAVENDLHQGIQWKYVFGSRKPSKQEDLFPLPQRAQPLDSTSLHTAALRAPQRRSVPSATPARVAPVSAPSRPLVAKQRMSSVRPTIWAVADRMWQEAGSPKDKAVVLELRKKMMNVLEEQGVKRTSSSNELGNWQKERLT